MPVQSHFDFFVPCPRGLEAMLADELRDIAHFTHDTAFTVAPPVPGGVPFRGSWRAMLAANLHSRIASRVLLKIAARPYRDEQDIYALTHEQAWEHWFDANHTLRVDISAIKSPLRSLEFTTLRVKDAICDRLRARTGARPSIDTATPDVRVSAFLTATDCTLYLDTSGEPLFKRGWRLDKGAAPLRENLAAGILRLAHWTPATPLYDPMCGSGTFLAEAAQIALGIAPGIERCFGFEKLKQHDTATWQTLKAAALDAKHAARACDTSDSALPIFGSDISSNMLAKARMNLERAGVAGLSLKQIDARHVVAPCSTSGILIANPPYGERIDVRGRPDHAEAYRGEKRHSGEHFSNEHRNNAYDSDHDNRVQQSRARFERARPDEPDAEFFKLFGDTLKQHFAGWHAFVLTSERKLPGQLRLRESAKTPLYNGALECRLFRFDLVAGAVRQRTNRSEP